LATDEFGDENIIGLERFGEMLGHRAKKIKPDRGRNLMSEL
jgi:hypothetical protein